MDSTQVLLSQIQQLREEIRNIVVATKSILNTDEAAQLLGLSKEYVYKLCQWNEIPHYKSKGGRKTYFKREDLEDWMLHYRVSTNEELQEKVSHRYANA